MANFLSKSGLVKYDELIKQYISEYTTSFSATDRQNLDTLVAMLATDDSDQVVNTIGEILAIFEQYPEGDKVAEALAGKVDKVEGMGLSQNSYTNEEKSKLAGIEAGANKTVIENVLTSDSTANALSAAQGKALKGLIDAINTDMANKGAGDMLKSVYDVDGDGIVDTAANANKLGGVAASEYAKSSEIPTEVSALTNDAGYITSEAIPTDLSGFTNNAGYAKSSEIPTEVSALTNDAGYITSEAVPTDLSGFTNNAGYAKSSEIPTNVSALNNDAGYTSDSEIPVSEIEALFN